MKPVRQGVSPELRSMARLSARALANVVAREREEENDPRPVTPPGRRPAVPDPVVQSYAPVPNDVALPLTIGQNFDGIFNIFGVLPPDTQGDVSPDYYVQWVNLGFSVYSKTGTLVGGPYAGNVLWTGFGGACESHNDGDPITLYDHLANRWLMSQFAVQAADGNHQCVAISATSDPLGAYYLYDFNWGPLINDYPKIGVWPDGYYLTVNQFTTTSYAGAGVAVFERDKMLYGQPARMVAFGQGGELGSYYSIQPAHLEGPPPPPGAPNPFLQLLSLHLGDAMDGFQFWQFHVDWSDPLSSTFDPNGTVATSAFDGAVCVNSAGTSLDRNCVPQTGTSSRLDSISGRAMYRAQYRNFGDHESIVVTTTVDVDPTTIADAPSSKGIAGQRWYELRDPNGTPTLYQEGSFAPAGLHRWMGSMAMDGNGNIALGYSTSSATDYPAIAFTGRHAGDPLGSMTESEQTLHAGTGSQTSSSHRWGDYSTMSVDPADDCTFWYTTEYLNTTSSSGWRTRIGSFSFPDCVPAPTGTLTGTVTAQGDGPIEGAVIHAGAYSAVTAGDGTYSIEHLPAGNYDLTVDAYGYASASANGIAIVASATTIQDFDLEVLPTAHVVGFVTDADAGWPLYAKVDITAAGGFSTTVYTNPATGEYFVNLADGVEHDFHVTAMSGTYGDEFRTVIPPSSENFALTADPVACDAAGFSLQTIFSEDMNGGSLPTNWTVVNNNIDAYPNGADEWRFDNPLGWSNYTGGSGATAIADSVYSTFYVGYGLMDTELQTPELDLTGYTGVQLRFASALFFYYPYATGDVDLNVNAGGWNNVWSRPATDGDQAGTVTVPIPDADDAASVQLRWHYYDAFYDYFWQVDDVQVASCVPPAGDAGLIVGNVYDENTGQPINGATVSDDLANETTTVATPSDPDLDDGYYSLASQEVTRTVTASAPNYGDDVASVNVTAGGAKIRNFQLPAGLLTGDPLVVTLGQDRTRDVTLEIANDGGNALGFDARERNYPVPPTYGPLTAGQLPSITVHRSPSDRTATSTAQASAAPSVMAVKAKLRQRRQEALQKMPPERRQALEKKLQELRSRSDVERPGGNRAESEDSLAIAGTGSNRPDTQMNAPSVGTSFLTGLAAAYGIGYDPLNDKLWIGNIAAAGGDDNDYRFELAGTPVGDGVDMSPVVSTFMADFAYNASTETLWQVTLDKCIYEIDPVDLALTGNSICVPDLSTSQRGLAYDPITDTYYSGSFNDGVIHQFTPGGTILRSVFVGINVTGLALNPATGHLFVLESHTGEDAVYVLDAGTPNLDLLSSLTLTDGSANTIQSAGAGLDMDCSDNLLATDFAAGREFSAPSGESGSCDIYDIPWLSITSGTGLIAAHSGGNIELSFDTTGLAEGTYDAHLLIFNDTPYGSKRIAIQLVVQNLIFADGFESGDTSAWSGVAP